MLKNLFLVLFLINLHLFGADWPQWRGADRDGVWIEKGIVESLPNSLSARWRVPVGQGYSGPTVANGLVFVTDRVTEPVEQERVHCFRASDGKPVWSHAYDCTYRRVGYPAGPRTSVLVEDDRAYSLGTMGHLFCFNARDGKVLWKKDLDQEYDIRMPTWGIAASPLIEGDILILHIGGRDNACVIGLNKHTGKEIWRALEDDASYSSPIVIDQAGKRVLVVWTADFLSGLDPVSGQIYWQVPYKRDRMIIGISTPVIYKDYILVSGFYDGTLLVKLSENQLAASKVWHRKGKNERDTDALHCCISTPVILDGYIYGVDSYGELRCLDLDTGDRLWESLQAVQKNRWANIHLIRHGDKIWMFNEHGQLIISQLDAEGYNEISRGQLIEPTTAQLDRKGTGVTWAHPAFANKHVFIRNDKELLCASLEAN
jgi:outer membrane protein assembly factor BamB